MHDVGTKEAERLAFLKRIETAESFEELRSAWRGDEEDWAILGAFARRPDLPPAYMEALHARNTWFLNIALCHNPATPIALLRRLARLEEGARIPTFVEDCEDGIMPDDIVRIARTVLRRRESV